MPSVTQTIKFRRQQRARDLRKPWVKLGWLSGLWISLMAVLITIAGLWFYINLTRDFPSVEMLPSLLETPNGTLLQPTRLYDRSHEHVILTLENPGAAGRQYIKVGVDGQADANQVSKYLVDATISELDPNFWNHQGYTLAGIFAGTHSTLAQILISRVVLVDEPPSLNRNIRERMLAAQVTSTYGREKILEWFLNSAQYGDLIYGADAVARVYLGKSAMELSLAEAALLTAMEEIPGINPLTGFQILKKQQELIIQRMLVNGLVTGDEARIALKEVLKLQDQIEFQPLAPEFTQLVLDQLSSVIPLDRIYRGGYEIVTTLDYELQLQAECASQAQIARISGTTASTVTLDGTLCESSLLLPTLQQSAENSAAGISAEAVILNPQSGQILALVGEDASGMLESHLTPHPAGTLLSPFLYLTAFTRGMSPATLLWDIPSDNGGDITTPVQNELTQGLTTTYHGPVSLRKAFVNDYSGAAVEVLKQVGIENVWVTEKQFGINTPVFNPGSETILNQFYSQQITLLDGMQAYSVLANQGIMTGQPGIENATSNTDKGLKPSSILSVVDVSGQIWLNWTKPQEIAVVNPQITYLTTNVLSDEKARWPTLGHPNALEIGKPVGAKVGVTSDANNTWVIGYIPQLVVGVWMGQSFSESGGITPDLPAGLWHALMQYASSDMPTQDFTPPSGISRVQVCDPSGQLVAPLCPTIVQEVFLSGNEPTQTDDLYQKVYIDRETGSLATIFTPSDQVDEKVYLAFPTQAQAWAKLAGQAIPPDTYDPIVAPSASPEEVQLTSPKMFAQLGGKIDFVGTANGENFSYYRLQVGQGLYPKQWLQIGEDVIHPVSDGWLGTWDTQGLEGVYIIELMLVKQDLKIEHALLQLTIDNVPPQVQIISPKIDEQFAYKEGEDILMNVSVSDNLQIQRVEFYIDNMLQSILFEPPFTILWDAQVGEHNLRVKAYDSAGNPNETMVVFSVTN